MKKVCCCTGHRPQGFVWNYYDKNLVEHQGYLMRLAYFVEKFVEEGYDCFVSGGAIGADMDFAEIVIRLKKKYPHIRLEIVVPCAHQDRMWRPQDKARYQSILQQADEVTVLFSRYTPWCYDKRNRYMVDKSDLVLAVWNGEKIGGTYQTKKYAEKTGKQLECILLPPKNADEEIRFHYLIENGVTLEDVKKKDEGIKKVLKALEERERENH
ncbi:MAG: DUF1273 family protein [Clostridia bacterium]|nr:DUF1273 family protein [Clostridia bacterium]